MPQVRTASVAAHLIYVEKGERKGGGGESLRTGAEGRHASGDLWRQDGAAQGRVRVFVCVRTYLSAREGEKGGSNVIYGTNCNCQCV